MRSEGTVIGSVGLSVCVCSKGAWSNCHRSARVAIRSVPLVPQSTALLFSLRYLRSGLSSSNLKFARFLHCVCSVSTQAAGRLTFSTLNGLRPAPTVTIDHAGRKGVW